MNTDAIKFTFKLRDKTLYWANPAKASNKNRRVKGSKSSRGYYYVSFIFKGTKYVEKRSRIIWLLSTGNKPRGVIDHINGNPSDDSIENLRDISQSENLRNNKRFRDGEIIGVCYDNRYRKPWKVQFSIKRKTYYFGRYTTEQEAQKIAIKQYGEILRARD